MKSIVDDLLAFDGGFRPQDTPVTHLSRGRFDDGCQAAGKTARNWLGRNASGQHFDAGKVRIENRAMNGRSTKTFISEGRWQKIVDELKKGDFVFVQFGHNDQSKDKGERYTPPEDYRKNLIRFVEEVRAKGGTPVLLTPVMRRRFDKDGKFYDTHGEYPDIVRAVARENKVPLIDMHKLSETVIVKYGVEDSKKLFLQLKPGENANYPNGIDDNTHFSPLGAEEMAKRAVAGIRDAKLKLQKFLKPNEDSILYFHFYPCVCAMLFAQATPLSERLADTAMNRIWVDARNQPGIPPKWNYEQGVILKAIEQMWYATGDPKYFRHIQKGMDHWIDENGNHKDYHLEEYNIDHITPGTAMMTLYRVTGNEKYRKIVELLRSQLKTHPRTKEGGFWHKKIYPWQMWLDGLYMGEPFYAEYSKVFGEDNWNDIANQFVWMEKHARDDEDRVAISRLGRIERAAVGEQRNRKVAARLGTCDGLVRDGARRHARAFSERPSAA